METIFLNPIYSLKPDKGRSLIVQSFAPRDYLYTPDTANTYVIHPIYAIILSFMDGRNPTDCIKDAADNLNVSQEYIHKLVEGWFDNEDSVKLKTEFNTSIFPPHLLVSSSKFKVTKYDYQDFLYDNLDITMKRHASPTSLTLMLNNICATKCIYCYQDKRTKVSCSIPFERIRELIEESHKIGVVNFDVIGGEFFLYPHWKELLSELKAYGYNPFLSTKVSLSEEDVKFLAEIGIIDIQISIDSMIPNHLQDSLGVSQTYPGKMREFLKILSDYDIPVLIHSVLTVHNDSIEDMDSIYNSIKDMHNIIEWKVVKGDESLYPQVPFNEIEISDNAILRINSHLDNLNKNSLFPIKSTAFPKGDNMMISASSTDIQKELKHFLRKGKTYCSGLFSHLYILPDGNVTMCEQLYWNKDFIVGNVKIDSIMNVWNSRKSLEIFYIKQEDIPMDSFCSKCPNFHECRDVRQVCYREIVRKFGKDKWYYPDVNCPFAKLQDNIKKNESHSSLSQYSF